MNPQNYTYLRDKAHDAAKKSARRIIDLYGKARIAEGDEQDDVIAMFGAVILDGIIDGLMEYYPVDAYQPDVVKAIREADGKATNHGNGDLNEGKTMKKPSLREAQRIVALVSGENAKRVREQLSSVEEENEAVEKFCILMDWEVAPEDVLHCVKNGDGTFTMQVIDGTQFKYNPVEDCLE